MPTVNSRDKRAPASESGLEGELRAKEGLHGQRAWGLGGTAASDYRGRLSTLGPLQWGSLPQTSQRAGAVCPQADLPGSWDRKLPFLSSALEPAWSSLRSPRRLLPGDPRGG